MIIVSPASTSERKKHHPGRSSRSRSHSDEDEDDDDDDDNDEERVYMWGT